jgi:hypothetical protein
MSMSVSTWLTWSGLAPYYYSYYRADSKYGVWYFPLRQCSCFHPVPAAAVLGRPFYCKSWCLRWWTIFTKPPFPGLLPLGASRRNDTPTSAVRAGAVPSWGWGGLQPVKRKFAVAWLLVLLPTSSMAKTYWFNLFLRGGRFGSAVAVCCCLSCLRWNRGCETPEELMCRVHYFSQNSGFHQFEGQQNYCESGMCLLILLQNASRPEIL